MNDAERQKKGREAKRLGETIALILVAVNAVEFWLAVSVKYQPLLAIMLIFMALIDVVFIVWYYMHLPRLFGEDEEGHS